MRHACLLVGTLVCKMMSVPGCGTGASAGGDAERAIATTQNEAASKAAAKMTELLTRFDEFDLRHLEIDTYDETTGQEWLDFYDEFFVPGIEEVRAELETMAENEAELQALVEAAGASEQSLQPKLGMVALIYIGGALTFTAVVTTWAAFASRVVPQVDRVERSVQAGLDRGLNRAQAMAAASDDYIDAQDAVFFDLQITVASEAIFSSLSAAANQCGKILLDLVNIAGEAISIDTTQLFGKQKAASDGTGNRTQKGSFDQNDLFYLGQSEDGAYGNLPLGQYDFFVFKEGHVRGNVQDVSIETCSAVERVDVTMATMVEFFADDADDPPPLDSDVLGSCRVTGGRVCDLWFGPESARATVMEACTQPGNVWDEGRPCPEAESFGACSLMQEATITRVLVFYADRDWTSERLAREVAETEQECLAIADAVGGSSEWMSPYRPP